MLCQNCHEKNANIQLRLNLNGNQKHLMLCEDCYKTEKEKLGASFGSQMSGFSGFGDSPFNDMFKQFSGNMNDQNPNHNPASAAAKKAGGGNGFIDQYGRNLTQIAKTGLIDPVIGRDEEVQRVIEVLNRRNKNNPVLIGEPGVGKTAIAEGLALKIVEGDVPDKLKSKEVYLLDVASMVSNTGIRGQFEERMKQLISELQARKNIILFIDFIIYKTNFLPISII